MTNRTVEQRMQSRSGSQSPTKRKKYGMIAPLLKRLIPTERGWTRRVRVLIQRSSIASASKSLMETWLLATTPRYGHLLCEQLS